MCLGVKQDKSWGPLLLVSWMKALALADFGARVVG